MSCPADARRCYGHRAGECGVVLWDRLVAAGDAVRPCLDWTERRWHLGSALGRALLMALQERGVLAPSPAGDRVMLVDPRRWQAVLRGLEPGCR